MQVEKRYGALRVIATIYKIIGVIVALITVLAALGICGISAMGGAAANQFGSQTGISGLAGGIVGGLLLAVVAIIYGGGITLTLYAMGEGISLLIALEENTRVTAQWLQQQVGPPAPRA
jgi:hypothetical protein